MRSLSPQGSRLSAKYRSEQNVCCSSERRTPVERSDRAPSGVSEFASPSQLRRRKACNLSLKQNLQRSEDTRGLATYTRILHTLLIACRVWKPTITEPQSVRMSSFGATLQRARPQPFQLMGRGTGALISVLPALARELGNVSQGSRTNTLTVYFLFAEMLSSCTVLQLQYDRNNSGPFVYRDC